MGDWEVQELYEQKAYLFNYVQSQIDDILVKM